MGRPHAAQGLLGKEDLLPLKAEDGWGMWSRSGVDGVQAWGMVLGQNLRKMADAGAVIRPR
jgi:hypothetical protein